VNQFGHVQSIGAVNEKIEGFFDICAARGLNGEQGVLIPASNVKHLMLRRDVVAAANNGQFHIYAIETVDQAICLLTGLQAGAPDADGQFPEESINRKVAARLNRLTDISKSFMHHQERKLKEKEV
jgi:predicted ATP-dependent protease